MADIRERRQRLGWTQAQLARAAGKDIYPVHVSNFEKGRRCAKLIQEQIVAALVKEEELIERRRKHALHGKLFAALDPCAAKDRLLKEMKDRVVELYDECRFEEGDAILEFMPESDANVLLEWYFFDEEPANETSPFGK